MSKNWMKLSGSALILLLLVGCSGPKPAFTFEKESESVPAKVKFINQSEEAESYEWSFGDGDTSHMDSPQHRYLLSGRYKVTLTAKKEGKEKSLVKDIILQAPQICLVEMTTTAGTMMIQLFDATPQHRDNFIKLAEEGFYEGLLFHRVIDGFMIQGGDPQSRDAGPNARLGSGGPGYQIEAEFVDSLIHRKGALAAARQGDQVNPQRRSSGSQFYIVDGKPLTEEQLKQIEGRSGKTYTDEQRKIYLEEGGTPFLDAQYTVFGQVVEGMDVIDAIANTSTNAMDRPQEDIKILNVKVIK